MGEQATTPELDWDAIGQEALEHFRALLRFDTTNPPGFEAACAAYVRDVLAAEGIASTWLEPSPDRVNVVARLDGGNRREGLLLSAHMDVVPAEAEYWTHPPFAAQVADGYLWGRGAIDMKNMLVYSLMGMVLAKRTGLTLGRDLVLAAVADEENGMNWGSKYLIASHPELIEAGYCLGEVGGFTLHIGGQHIYPIQVAEKGVAWLKMTMRGRPGHGSMPHEDNAVAKLARAVHKLATTRLPRHPHPTVSAYIGGMAEAVRFPFSVPLKMLLNPAIGDWILDHFPNREQAKVFNALLHDTATPTGLQAGKKTNVIPSTASVVLDCRVLPGSSCEAVQAEIRAIVGDDVEFEILQATEPAINSPDTDLFRLIGEVLRERDPGCHPVPALTVGYTDGAYYNKLGMTTYGFAPILLPADLAFSNLYHGHDERIPLDGFHWGLRTFWEVVSRFCGPYARG